MDFEGQLGLRPRVLRAQPAAERCSSRTPLHPQTLAQWLEHETTNDDQCHLPREGLHSENQRKTYRFFHDSEFLELLAQSGLLCVPGKAAIIESVGKAWLAGSDILAAWAAG